VSLQGSLDTFALPDVLVLLASTKKSGELHVAGSRTPSGGRSIDLQGLLWVDDGRLVGHEVGRAPDAASAVFELLRLTEGSFSFVAGMPPSPLPPIEIEPVLADAQAFLVEWQEIERVVPSLSAWVRLAPEPPAAHVSMRADQWRLVVATAGGCDVAAIVDHLAQGELPGCRAVKELVEAGLAEISTGAPGTIGLEAYAGSFGSTVAGSAGTLSNDGAAPERDEPAEPDEALSEPAPESVAAEGIVDFDSLITLPPRASKPRSPSRSKHTLKEPVSPRRQTLGSFLDDQPDGHDDTQQSEAEALARQLASITAQPQDELAMEAPFDHDAHAADPDSLETAEGDEPLNRGLLLKFLSSVRN